MKYDDNRNCNYWELTIVRLLYILIMSRIGVVDGNERAYMHRLKEELF